ncbi:hypothetical protein OP10G_2091 [Fimbriimonas ginsengisoli Gsoil 348]|uniref:DUF2961 domain-containing protein n=1 Tax=Fimbriimonas ginsengisoli Gsoil 348 TaxID=661478 RepID=A0A068NV49_FIMGI|nr:hypothetical protein OP10G_2091 [Fimbriimonas ginsengisoli Gsoil 348]
MQELFEKPKGVETRWFSPENPEGKRGSGGRENAGSKGRPYVSVAAGETATLLEFEGSGVVRRMWVTIGDRSPEMLRSLRIEMFWDGAASPAVSVPFGDFFGIGLGRRTPFENALFSDPEGRSFNCFIPMPFRQSARVAITNDSAQNLRHLFYDIDVTVNESLAPETIYFHACWRRESPNELGKEFAILPRVEGSGRFLGCNLGIITDPRYDGTWWGEGEVKIRTGDDQDPTLCGTGTEDYVGTGWGQGSYAHRTQGCLIADKERRHWAFYRYHVDDPVYFDGGCTVSIQTIGGIGKPKALELLANGVPMIPVTLDPGDPHPMIHLMGRETPVDLATEGTETDWCNFWRQDDWSAVAYFYLDRPENSLPPLAPAAERVRDLNP